MTGQTTIYEMRELVDGDEFTPPVDELLTPTGVSEYPHRDYDALSRVVETCETRKEMCQVLDTDASTLRRWLIAYGFDEDKKPVWQRLEDADIHGLGDD